MQKENCKDNCIQFLEYPFHGDDSAEATNIGAVSHLSIAELCAHKDVSIFFAEHEVANQLLDLLIRLSSRDAQVGQIVQKPAD